MESKQHATQQPRDQRGNQQNIKANENKTVQSVWDSVKTILRGKFIVMQHYIKKNLRQSNFIPKELLEEQSLKLEAEK